MMCYLRHKIIILWRYSRPEYVVTNLSATHNFLVDLLFVIAFYIIICKWLSTLNYVFSHKFWIQWSYFYIIYYLQKLFVNISRWQIHLFLTNFNFAFFLQSFRFWFCCRIFIVKAWIFFLLHSYAFKYLWYFLYVF